MKQTGRTNHLPSRIGMFVSGVFVFVMICMALADPEFRKSLNFVTGFIFVVTTAIAGFGIWLSIKFRIRASDEVGQLHVIDGSTIAANAIVCPFSTGLKSASITIDPDAAMIYFENCFVPRRFLASAQKLFSCPVSDVRGVHQLRLQREESLTIITTTGTAVIPATATNYFRMFAFLKEAVPVSQPGFSTDHPLMGIVYGAGAMIGLLGGALLTPRNANDGTLAAFVFCGSVIGVASSYLAVRLGDLWLKTNLAKILGYAAIGAGIGMAVTIMVGPIIGFGILPISILILSGGVIGMFVGRKAS